MSLVPLALVALYASSNAWFAVEVRRAPTIAAVFGLAATALAVAVATRSTTALVAGTVLASIGPLLVGVRLHGRVRVAHHVLRGITACGIVALWIWVV